jgi:hypothetical protein
MRGRKAKPSPRQRHRKASANFGYWEATIRARLKSEIRTSLTYIW